MSGITLTDEKQGGRPYGTTREEFLTTTWGHTMADWLTGVEQHYGLLERIASLGMKDGRIFILARFERAWMLNLHNPGNAPTQQEFQCFLSPEAMLAFWGLHEYLTTAQTNEAAWNAFMQVIDDAHDITQEATP